MTFQPEDNKVVFYAPRQFYDIRNVYKSLPIQAWLMQFWYHPTIDVQQSNGSSALYIHGWSEDSWLTVLLSHCKTWLWSKPRLRLPMVESRILTPTNIRQIPEGYFVCCTSTPVYLKKMTSKLRAKYCVNPQVNGRIIFLITRFDRLRRFWYVSVTVLNTSVIMIWNLNYV